MRFFFIIGLTTKVAKLNLRVNKNYYDVLIEAKIILDIFLQNTVKLINIQYLLKTG